MVWERVVVQPIQKKPRLGCVSDRLLGTAAEVLVLGSPAKVVKSRTGEELERNRVNAAHYVRLSKMYLGLDRPSTNLFYVDERAH